MAHPHMHAHDDGSPLGFTGERVVPGDPGIQWCFEAHKFAYDDLVDRIEPGARVLDVGCGEGYGPAILARTASLVVASDYSAEAVAHAARTYGRDRMAWVVCDAQRLPFAPASFDVVTSLQVIEHFTDTGAHLAGVARALRPGGWHYVATPNIAEMSPEEAANEFHLRDFTAPDLQDALSEHFAQVELLGMFYREDSPRVRAMRAAESDADAYRPRLERIERLVARLRGPLRVRARRVLRKLAAVPATDADAARNAIVASDFEARPPAEESFCLIGIARAPRVSGG